MYRLVSSDIGVQYDILNHLIEICSIVQFYRSKEKNSFSTGALHDFNLLYQKSLIHAISIKHLSQKIGLYNPINNSYLPIIDPFSINVILRSLVESYLTFYQLSSSTSVEENQIRHMIWVVFGLYQRQKLTLSKSNRLYTDNEQKKSDELANIETIISNIEKNPIFEQLTLEKQISLKKQFKNDWKFEFRGNTYHPKGYQDIMNSIGFKNEFFANIYNSLSWSTHSTSIAISQFDVLWGKEKHDELFLKNSLIVTSSVLAFMTLDLANVDKDYSVGYDKLSKDRRQLLSEYHYFFR